MKIYGLDFTSAPSRSRPIALAECRPENGELVVKDLLRLPSLEHFERGLASPGPWVAALDFPFGLPRRLIEDLHWPDSWEGCVAAVAGTTRQEFEDVLLFYKEARPAGDKEHLRAADRAAGALSPMKLFGVPLAKMFYEGAPRLLHTSLSILPCRPTGDPRVVVEAYPALVARRLLGERRSYKDDARGKRTQARASARRALVEALASERAAELYGFRVRLGSFLAQGLVDDPRGDLLDAVLAALQAAWAHARAASRYGLPAECDPLEGWIVDPATRETTS